MKVLGRFWSLIGWHSVLTGGIRHLPTLITFTLNVGCITPVSVLGKVGDQARMLTAQGHRVATMTNLAISVSVHEGEFWLVLLTLVRWSDLIQHLCQWPRWRRSILFWWERSRVNSDCHNPPLFMLVIWPRVQSSDNFSPLTVFFWGGFMLTAL